MGRSIDLSWTQIRSADDQFFAHELRRRDADQSKKVGLRLKALREDRNLNQRYLAEASVCPAPQLSKIESGTSACEFSTVQSLFVRWAPRWLIWLDQTRWRSPGKTLSRRAEKAGVSADIMDRLISLPPQGFLVRTLSRAFGWRPESIVGESFKHPSSKWPFA